jgi:iron complex outermembrane recepter protein
MLCERNSLGAAISVIMGGATILAPTSVWAQDGVTRADTEQQRSRDAGEEAPTEIVVTAQRREERLLEVPISLTAFTSKDIENRGITSLAEIQTSVPGLRIVDIGPGSQRIQLRGISQYLGLPTVGNYIDEFSVNNEGASGSAEIRLLDIERVEVLRGPQPALYGEGSMGGTIRYVTASPDLNEFGANLVGELSSVKDGGTGYRAEGILNIPISTEVAGLRIAGAHERLPGWVDGALGKNANDQEITTARAKLLLQPVPALTISLLGLYHESMQDVKNYSKVDRTTDQIVPSTAQQKYYLSNLIASYDFGSVTLLSSTGYLNQDSRSVDDSVKFYNQLFGAPLVQTAITDSIGDFTRWAQEFRLASNGDGPLSYLIGASYSDARSTGAIFGTGTTNVPGLPASALGLVFTQISQSKSEVKALFGSVSYDLTDRVTIDVGGRYFKDRRSIRSALSFTGAAPALPAARSGSFESFNPRVNVSYDTGGDGIIYANAAKGFRSGGFNSLAPNIPPTFGPEKLWSYEIGTRQSLIRNQLFVEAAIYYNDYKGIQATIIQNGAQLGGTRNAGNADGFGADLTFRVQPIRALSISGTVGWNDVRYNTLSPDRFPGDPLDLVPTWTWSTSIDYSPRFNERMGLIFHADAGFSDEAQITLRNFAAFGLDPIEQSESRAVVNARLGVSFASLDIYAFANNLFDENRIVNPAFGAFFEEIRTRPRTLGLGMRGRF